MSPLASSQVLHQSISPSLDPLLADAAQRALRYLSELRERRVAPSPDALRGLDVLDERLGDEGVDARAVLALLDEVGSPGTVASAGGRYFGFVTGGALPATVAANWLAGAWDQNSAFEIQSPATARIEAVAVQWMCDLFGLPRSAGAGVVTGATMANFTALAAARHALLARAGWDVEEQGLFGAPALTVVVGQQVHVSVRKALSLLGLGRSRVKVVPADDQGRLRADRLPTLNKRTIVCIQAGNVNSGAFDPATEVCARAQAAGAWVHVDGAFGLWAAAAPERAHLMAGFQDAHSWATDCHKWLNVPYDCGVAFVREAAHLRGAMAATASYLQEGTGRDSCYFAPEFSRRARGVEIWAALKSLGRRGLAAMIERNCRQATYMADRLRSTGFAVLNDVVLNQVLVAFGSPDATRRTIQGVQADGTCWCGGTEWNGEPAMRISVSCWATTDEDVERSLEAIIRIAGANA